MTAATFQCATCSSAISAEDLAQGLAVRIDGHLTCSMCVDLLPGRAQVEINTIRAIKGLSATTYRVAVPGHPQHLRYTFTTAGNVLGHRRQLKSTGIFEVPLLPIAARRTRPGTPTPTAGTTVPPPPPRRRQRAVLVGLSAGLVLVVGLLITLLALNSHPSRAGAASPGTATAAGRSRADYPRNPFDAYLAASIDPVCPPDLLAELQGELSTSVTVHLDAAEDALHSQDLAVAAESLAVVHLPAQAVFDDLRSRRARLAAALDVARRQVQAQAHPIIAAAPDPGPAVDATPVHAPAPPAPRPAPPPPAPARVGPAPAGPCWLIPVAEVMPTGNADWSDGGILHSPRGEMHRTLPELPGGQYQLWIRALQERGNGSLLVQLGGHQQTLIAEQAQDLAWVELGHGLKVQPGRNKLLKISGIGQGWQVTAVYLATDNFPGPEAASSAGLAQACPWPPLPAAHPTPPQGDAQSAIPPAVPPAPLVAAGARQVAVWHRDFQFPLRWRDVPLDGSWNVPSPWPGGAEPFTASASFPREGQELQTLELALPRAAIEHGGIVLILNAGREGRTQLRATLEWSTLGAAAGGSDPGVGIDAGLRSNVAAFQSLALAPVPLQEGTQWQVATIPLPTPAALPAQCWLRLDDQPTLVGDGRPFFVGAAVTVAGGAPTAADLPLLPPPLLLGDVIHDRPAQARLRWLLDRVIAHRSNHPSWHEVGKFNPSRVCLLAANPQLWKAALKTTLLQRLQDVDNDTRRAPVVLAWTPAPDVFKLAEFGLGRPLVDPATTTVACVSTTGVPPAILADPDRMAAWVRDMSLLLCDGDGNHRCGVLPVLVFGPLGHAATPEEASAYARYGNDLSVLLTDLPIPVIDLRAALQIRPAEAQEAAAQRQLVDGLRCLVYQIRWLQAHSS